jgi:phosphohistidine swiveling domain-containing protein
MADLTQSFDQLAAEQQPLAGGKGGTLARLYQAGYPVPDGFVILPAAFAGDELTGEAWTEVQAHLGRMRKNGTAFAVRSSALSEDSDSASFAGEFETVLDVHSDDMVRAAIRSVRRSRHSERVRAYSLAQGLEADHDMAVVVQQLVRADISGVLFTANPVSGSHAEMMGNFVYGFGEELVSGEAEPYTFTLTRPKGRYEGPEALKPHARKLYKLASRLHKELGGPQDIEWAIADATGSRPSLYVLQSRPITTLQGYNPATGAWNHSLTGDFLWSRNNYGEARPDVMTPLTWSVSSVVYEDLSFLPGYSMAGNICGRFYANISVMVSMMVAMGKDVPSALEELKGLLGHAPEEVEVPLIPLPRSMLLLALPRMIGLAFKEKQGGKKVPGFLAENPTWCRRAEQQFQAAQTGTELVSLWHDELWPYFTDIVWIMAGGYAPFEASMKLHKELVELVGEADANALLSKLSDEANLGSGSGLMESMGPVVGVARVARGEMSRGEYLERYGHRGPHEMELAAPRPAEDPAWLDRQLEEFNRSPVDVDALLAKQHAEFEAAWRRLEERHPKKARSLKRRIDGVGPAARMREAVRSEMTRVYGVVRAWALRAGELTGLGDDVFFLSVDELLDVLSGQDSAARQIPARRETYQRYKALPPTPMIIRGRFDPFQWAADPDRRGDVYDAQKPVSASKSVRAGEPITGYAGAAGCVDGTVRVLDDPEQGHQLQAGEVLVAVTTNVGWTPLFLRAVAVVTDVGAPLSHAAIVARELGIPAVVGCVDATTRLRTGDRVRVDGGHGLVEILKTA